VTSSLVILRITFEDLLCYIYFNVSAINYKCISILFYISLLRNAIIRLLTRLSFIGSCYVLRFLEMFRKEVKRLLRRCTHESRGLPLTPPPLPLSSPISYRKERVRNFICPSTELNSLPSPRNTITHSIIQFTTWRLVYYVINRQQNGGRCFEFALVAE
jgi:hypothetical protein